MVTICRKILWKLRDLGSMLRWGGEGWQANLSRNLKRSFGKALLCTMCTYLCVSLMLSRLEYKFVNWVKLYRLLGLSMQPTWRQRSPRHRCWWWSGQMMLLLMMMLMLVIMVMYVVTVSQFDLYCNPPGMLLKTLRWWRVGQLFSQISAMEFYKALGWVEVNNLL